MPEHRHDRARLGRPCSRSVDDATPFLNVAASFSATCRTGRAAPIPTPAPIPAVQPRVLGQRRVAVAQRCRRCSGMHGISTGAIGLMMSIVLIVVGAGIGLDRHGRTVGHRRRVVVVVHLEDERVARLHQDAGVLRVHHGVLARHPARDEPGLTGEARARGARDGSAASTTAGRRCRSNSSRACRPCPRSSRPPRPVSSRRGRSGRGGSPCAGPASPGSR